MRLILSLYLDAAAPTVDFDFIFNSINVTAISV